MENMYLDMNCLQNDTSFDVDNNSRNDIYTINNNNMDSNVLIDALKKEIDILKKKNTKLYYKKKNIARANLRLRNKLKFQTNYIISLKQNNFDVEKTKFKPVLCPIPEIPQNKTDTEWDYIENDEIKEVLV